MSLQSGAEGSTGYLSRLFTIVSTSATPLISAPSQPHRAEARRRLARHALLTSTVAAILVVALMIWFDAQEIALMPPRGTASLWPFRILTDFGKDNYVLLLLAVLLLAVLLVAPALHGPAERRLLAIGLRLQFMVLAISVPLVKSPSMRALFQSAW